MIPQKCTRNCLYLKSHVTKSISAQNILANLWKGDSVTSQVDYREYKLVIVSGKGWRSWPRYSLNIIWVLEFIHHVSNFAWMCAREAFIKSIRSWSQLFILYWNILNIYWVYGSNDSNVKVYILRESVILDMKPKKLKRFNKSQTETEY